MMQPQNAPNDGVRRGVTVRMEDAPPARPGAGDQDVMVSEPMDVESAR